MFLANLAYILEHFDAQKRFTTGAISRQASFPKVYLDTHTHTGLPSLCRAKGRNLDDHCFQIPFSLPQVVRLLHPEP